eukprot:scaffold694_cov188-Prasinococcus_capsulatus_cf.AAC.4
MMLAWIDAQVAMLDTSCVQHRRLRMRLSERAPSTGTAREYITVPGFSTAPRTLPPRFCSGISVRVCAEGHRVPLARRRPGRWEGGREGERAGAPLLPPRTRLRMGCERPARGPERRSLQPAMG